MRLSDAIALGRTLIHPMPGFVLDHSGLNGCALGMGYKANGGAASVHPLELTIGLEEVMRLWPWLESRVLLIPCKCDMTNRFNFAQMVGHLFDDHIMHGLIPGEALPEDRWTLDELIDWVRSVEPAEIAPQIENAEEKTSSVQAIPA